jgi:hypothetical protein
MSISRSQPEASLYREQDDDTVAKRVAGCFGEKEEIVDLVSGQYLCLLARHNLHRFNSATITKQGNDHLDSRLNSFNVLRTHLALDL